MESDGILSAYLRSETETKWMKEGEVIEGWCVVEIESDRVLLDKEGHQFEKTIYDQR